MPFQSTWILLVLLPVCYGFTDLEQLKAITAPTEYGEVVYGTFTKANEEPSVPFNVKIITPADGGNVDLRAPVHGVFKMLGNLGATSSYYGTFQQSLPNPDATSKEGIFTPSGFATAPLISGAVSPRCVSGVFMPTAGNKARRLKTRVLASGTIEGTMEGELMIINRQHVRRVPGTFTIDTNFFTSYDCAGIFVLNPAARETADSVERIVNMDFASGIVWNKQQIFLSGGRPCGEFTPTNTDFEPFAVDLVSENEIEMGEIVVGTLNVAKSLGSAMSYHGTFVRNENCQAGREEAFFVAAIHRVVKPDVHVPAQCYRAQFLEQGFGNVVLAGVPVNVRLSSPTAQLPTGELVTYGPYVARRSLGTLIISPFEPLPVEHCSIFVPSPSDNIATAILGWIHDQFVEGRSDFLLPASAIQGNVLEQIRINAPDHLQSNTRTLSPSAEVAPARDSQM